MDKFAGSKRYAAQVAEEAGATRHFAARCVTCSAGSLPPRIAGCAMSHVPRAEAKTETRMMSFRNSQVKKVRISLSTVVCTDFCTLRAIHVTFRDGVRPKVYQGKAAEREQAKRAERPHRAAKLRPDP